MSASCPDPSAGGQQASRLREGRGGSRQKGLAEEPSSPGPGCPSEWHLPQFDYKAVADRLLAMTSRKGTPAFNRKRLSGLARK